MTTRKYQSLPENGTVETPFGTMAVRFMCDGDHPTITLDANAAGAFVTVNGVDVTVALTLTDYGDGFEIRRDEHGDTCRALYAGRRHPKGSDFDASAAARRKIRETLPAVAVEWAKGREKLFTIARRTTVNNDIHRLQVDLEEAEAKAAELRSEIAAGEKRYAAIR